MAIRFRLIRLFIVLITFNVCVVGCASRARYQTLESNKLYWFDYTADHRAAFLVPNTPGKGGISVCAEPAPDTALSTASKYLLKGGYQQANVDAEAQLTSSVVELAGRTETVLFLREAMYRLCEQAQDGSLDNLQIYNLYDKILRATVDLAIAERLKATDKLVETTQKASIAPATRKALDDLIRSSSQQ